MGMRSSARGGFPVFPAFNLELHRAANEFEQEKENEIGRANQQTIFEGIRGQTGERVSALNVGRRSASGFASS